MPAHHDLPDAPSRLVPNAEKGDPLALLLWGLLRHRSVADKALVLNACDERLSNPKRRPGDGADPAPQSLAKREQALYAVALFVKEEGHIPHGAEWDEWRTSTIERRHLPSASFIRNAFDRSWRHVRAAVEMEVAAGRVPGVAPDALKRSVGLGAELDPDSRRLRSNGVKFNDSDLITVLRAWATRRTGVLRRTEFFTWLQSDAPAEAGLRCWPRHTNPYRRFGRSFGEWLDAAGIDSIPATTPTATPTTQPTPKLVSSIYRPSSAPNVKGPLPRCTATDWETLGAWVRLAASETSGAGMGIHEYEQWVKTRIEDTVARGEMVEAIPSPHKLKSHAEGSWPMVKALSNVPGAEAGAELGTRYSYTRAELLDSLARAREAHPKLTSTKYGRWSKEERARLRRAKQAVRIPNVQLISDRFGGWPAAIQALEAERAQASSSNLAPVAPLGPTR